MVQARRSRCKYSWLGVVTILVISDFFVISVESYECPKSDLSDHVKFYLYSRFIPVRVELIPDNVTNLEDSGFRIGSLTKFITHGFQETPGFCNSTGYIINAFKKFTDFNLILVDWSALSGRQATDYPLVVECVRSSIAQYLGSYINFLAKRGVARENVHLIGHSLGAQLIGMAANYIDFDVPRLTALDPAGPFFDHIAPPGEKLDSKDAMVVDVLHTNSLLLGTEGPDGTIDFYMNGGTAQPKCSNLSDHTQPGQLSLDSWHSLTSVIGDLLQNALNVALSTSGCDHHRSYQIFARSINPANEFPSLRCDSVEDARSHKCHGRTGYAGYYLRDTEPGVYYTSTDGYNFKNLETEKNVTIIRGSLGPIDPLSIIP